MRDLETEPIGDIDPLNLLNSNPTYCLNDSIILPNVNDFDLKLLAPECNMNEGSFSSTVSSSKSNNQQLESNTDSIPNVNVNMENTRAMDSTKRKNDLQNDWNQFFCDWYSVINEPLNDRYCIIKY